MLKKIALVGIFAVTSLVSLASSTVNAARPQASGLSVTAPIARGLCPSACCR